jgi:hypothetical protein
VKKVLVIGIAAFLVSMGLGTGLRLLLAPAKGEGAHPEESSRDGQRAESGAASAIATKEHHPEPVPGLSASRESEPPSSHLKDELDSSGGELPGGKEDGPLTSPGGMEFREVARILRNMKSSEAVLLLTYLTDDQVLGILHSMRVREAAQVLARLPEKRAETIRERLFEPLKEETR